VAVPSHSQHEAAEPQPEAALAEQTALVPRDIGRMLALQRSAGNRAVGRMLASDQRSLISTGELATNWRRARDSRPGSAKEPGTRFRLPEARKIQAMMTAAEVPEDKIKEMVATGLTRMRRDGALPKTNDPIPDIIKRLFPSPGTFDEAEFAKVVDVADRKQMYMSAADAESKLTPADKTKLISAMGRADLMLTGAEGDAANIKRVFGTRAADAKANYGKARTALAELKKNIDTNVHTDYNGDDAQTGLGGWASFSSKMVHLEPDTVAAKDPDDAALTILHECMHLADASIGDDGGYYPSSVDKSAGWETMTDDEKVTNAAHYEEVPKRKLGKSVFKPDQTFKPGVSASTGGAISFENQVRLKARDYVRRAWDAAVDTHNGIRKVRVDTENGNAAALFATYEARILEVSAITKMTIHLQKPKPHTIATLDVTQCEGVAHGLSRMTRLVGKQPVPAAPVAPKTKQNYIDEAVAGAAKDYGALTGNATDDKTLIDWMVAHYGNVGLP
jgi:hypothetical protein